jgi:hypothetical protein
MDKAKYLYGRHLTPDFKKQALYFCNMAKINLKLHLTEVIASEGLGDRQEQISKALDWWTERENEFKLKELI